MIMDDNTVVVPFALSLLAGIYKYIPLLHPLPQHCVYIYIHIHIHIHIYICIYLSIDRAFIEIIIYRTFSAIVEHIG